MTTMREIEDVGRQIVQYFHPDRIVLFGSYARGTPGRDSDVDLLVIMPFKGKGLYRSLEILDRLDVRFPIDLIARRPDDVDRRYREGDPLIRDALDHGKVLYEKDG